MKSPLYSIHRAKSTILTLYLFLVTVAILFYVPNAYPQDRGTSLTPASSPPESTGDKTQPALVSMHNRVIVVFRMPLFNLSPENRAKYAEQRINRILSKGTIGEVTTKQIAEGTLFLIGEEEAFLITPGDMDPMFGQTSEEVVNRALRNLKLAIAEVKELRDPKIIVRGIAYSAVATVSLLLFLFGFNRVRRRINAAVFAAENRWIGKSQMKGFIVIQGTISFVKWLLKVTISLVALLAFYVWITFSLRQFPYTRAWGESMGEYLGAIVTNFVGGVLKALPGLTVIVLIVLLTRLITQIFSTLHRAIETRRITVPWFDAELASPTYRIITVTIWLFALIMAYPYMPGSGSAAFQGVSLFVGLIISLGSTSVVNQAAGGLVLMYSRAFKAADYVHVGDTEGTVLSLGILSTKIRTGKGEEIIIPNAVMVSNTTRNLTRLAGGRGALVSTKLTIGYSVPWRKVHELLIMAAGRTPGLLADPRPFVRQSSLSDFYVEYELVAVAEDPTRRGATLSALHGNIQDLFNEHEEQIMSPHYEADPQRKVFVPKEKWFDPLAGKGERAS